MGIMGEDNWTWCVEDGTLTADGVPDTAADRIEAAQHFGKYGWRLVETVGAGDGRVIMRFRKEAVASPPPVCDGCGRAFSAGHALLPEWWVRRTDGRWAFRCLVCQAGDGLAGKREGAAS
jgi:hypothetical protein